MFLSGSFAVTLQCSHQCDHSVPGSQDFERTKAMYQISTFAVSWECSCSVPLLVKFWEILGTLQAHARKTAKLGIFEMCLEGYQNSPKFSQKRYTAGTLPGHCKCTDLEHLWFIALVLFKFFKPSTL